MTATVTTAFWGMTVNNPDETTLALVRNGYPDYCREIIHTLEEGEEGTLHIQAWLKLQRQQRLSFVKKLFPRGHFKPLTSAEYVHNTKMYVQKDDETTRGAHVHVFHDPTGTIEALIPKVCQCIWQDKELADISDRDVARAYAERKLVTENWRLAKIFVSPMYRRIWMEYGSQIMTSVFEELEREHTHTHTHGDEKFSVVEGIPTDGSEGDDASEEASDASSASEGEASDGEDYEDGTGTEDEGYDESRSSCGRSSDDFS